MEIKIKHTFKRVVGSKFTWLLCGLIIGLFIAFFISDKNQPPKTAEQPSKYSLVSQRVLYGSTKKRLVNFTGLRDQLTEYVDANLPDPSKYSIYFEYLPTGTSIGMNEDNKMIGASLLKVPVAMQYYRSVENNEISSSEKVTIEKDDLDNESGDLYKKGLGYTTTLSDLVDIMIINSDNTALKAIVRILAKETNFTAEQLLDFVDINYTVNDEGRLYVDSQGYASILKCIYFACDLSLDDSQYLLDLLTKTPFDNRLKRYIEDEDLVVAHKIGNYLAIAQSDCGIFYEPDKDYLLCVMINHDDPLASEQIGQISLIVNKFIKNVDATL